MLETERLFLRPLDKNDTEAVYAMRSDRDVMRFIREPQSRAETESWIQLVSSLWEKENLGFCAVIEKKSGKFAGWCGVWRLRETGELEVGYAIAKDFWNKGFATEAAAKFLEYAFENINPEKITAVAEPENFASRRVMEKLGMELIKFDSFYNRKLVQYGIYKNEWNRRHGAKNFLTTDYA
ncbi:MAG TPA: GNAT family N-acetyltransferase [Pyrinomonadaceae bacterium]|jgi:ribosomal-protein-alanine N-acetyltransferase